MEYLSTANHKALVTLLLSMVPVLELRGAIPIGVTLGLDFKVAILVAIIGNLIPVPFLILFTKRVFEVIRNISPKLDLFVRKMEQKAAAKSDIVQRYAFWGLVVLVAIPLPGTGAWTGSLIAAMLNMRIRKAFPAIALGVLIAAGIVAFVTYGAGALLFSS